MQNEINNITNFKGMDVPSIQNAFLNQFDGTIESVVKFEQLHLILNPAFSYHYFFVSGTCDEDTITTKHTDGSCEAWGNQSQQAERNAFELSIAIKAFIMAHNPQSLGDIVGHDNHNELRKYGKINNVRNRATLILNGHITPIAGLKVN